MKHQTYLTVFMEDIINQSSSKNQIHMLSKRASTEINYVTFCRLTVTTVI